MKASPWAFHNPEIPVTEGQVPQPETRGSSARASRPACYLPPSCCQQSSALHCSHCLTPYLDTPAARNYFKDLVLSSYKGLGFNDQMILQESCFTAQKMPLALVTAQRPPPTDPSFWPWSRYKAQFSRLVSLTLRVNTPSVLPLIWPLMSGSDGLGWGRVHHEVSLGRLHCSLVCVLSWKDDRVRETRQAGHELRVPLWCCPLVLSF